MHLEMVNILIAIRLLKFHWASQRILICCGNEVVVTVLKTGKIRDPYLAACTCNIWHASALSDIDLQYAHIRGVDNKVSDVLSRWQGSAEQIQRLYLQVDTPIWLQPRLLRDYSWAFVPRDVLHMPPCSGCLWPTAFTQELISPIQMSKLYYNLLNV